MTRECGECSECCKWFPAPSVNEDISKPCQHLRKPAGLNNCLLQKNKPVPCVSFRCAWLQGHGLEEDRPDKSGIIMGLGDSNDYKPFKFVIADEIKLMRYKLAV